MEQEQQAEVKSRLVQFLTKRWSGLLILVLFIVFLVFAYYPHKISSDKMRGGQIFFADYREGASCEIVNPPDRIEIVVSAGPILRIEKGVLQGDQDKMPYQMQRTSGAIKISMLDPNVSPENAKNIWHHHTPVVELGNGFRRYQISHDVPLMGVTGVYIVKGNTIAEHHFIVRYTILIVPAILVIVVYLPVAKWRKIKGRNRGETNV